MKFDSTNNFYPHLLDTFNLPNTNADLLLPILNKNYVCKFAMLLCELASEEIRAIVLSDAIYN